MKIKTLISLSLIVLLGVQSLKAQNNLERVQAMFMYNFLSNVEWTQHKINDKYIIGVVGYSNTTQELKNFIEGRTVAGKPIQVVEYNNIEEIRNCHILFVPNSESSKIKYISSKLNGTGCLIVSEKSGMTRYGSAIAFNVVDGKLKYSLNMEAAKINNLNISQSLVQMSI